MKESHHLKCEICLSEFQPELVEGISTEPAIGPVRSRYDVDSEAQRPDPNASSPRNWKPVIVTVGILAVLIGGYWSRPTCARSSLFALRSSLFARPDSLALRAPLVRQVITIYMGAHRGLNSKERAKIDIKNALAAPFLASVSLFGFFLLIKYFPDFNLATLLDCYFFLLAASATLGAASGPLKTIANKTGTQLVGINISTGTRSPRLSHSRFVRSFARPSTCPFPRRSMRLTRTRTRWSRCRCTALTSS